MEDSLFKRVRRLSYYRNLSAIDNVESVASGRASGSNTAGSSTASSPTSVGESESKKSSAVSARPRTAGISVVGTSVSSFVFCKATVSYTSIAAGAGLASEELFASRDRSSGQYSRSLLGGRP